MSRILALPLLGLLAIYKYLISPAFMALGVRCRHYPSCSAYSEEAIRQYGPWAGGWMTLARVLRCNPYGTHGVDNVPKTVTKPPFYAPWRYGRWRGTNTDE